MQGAERGISDRGRLLALRWAAVAGLAVALPGLAPDQRILWAGIVALGLTGLVLHALPRPGRRGEMPVPWVLLADGAILALLGAGAFAGRPDEVRLFLVSLLVASLAGGAVRGVLATTAILALHVGLAGVPALGGRDGLGSLVWALPLLYGASAYFAALSTTLREQVPSELRARRESQELRALLEITEAVTGTLDLQRVMGRIVKRVGETVGAERCSILLVDGRRRKCFVLAAREDPDAHMLEVDLAKYPELRQAIETREPVVVEDVANDPLVASVREVLLDQGYRSLVVVPMVFGKEVLGTLFLRASRGRPFTTAEIRFCRVAAASSANALKNALLYRDVEMEAARHRSTGQKLRRVLDATPDMILATDSEGRITEFNTGAERVTGLPATEAKGASLEEVLDTRAHRGLEPGATAGDLVLRRPDGREAEINLISAPLQAPDGSSAGRVWIGRDVTRLRQAEKSLAQTERLSSLGEVVAGVAHELNNPLSSVLGYAQLSLGDSKTPSKERDIERIVESARRCQRIVQNLLSFSRQQPPEKKRQDLNACVAKVIELRAYHLKSSGIEVEAAFDPSLPEVSFDFHQMEQVLLNLINNAEQAIATTGGQGRITVRTRSDGEEVRVEIEDDGPGVPVSIRHRIFDPFFTTKAPGQGTGLGLSVSYGILREHGGRLELLPERLIRGSCFVVALPRAAAEAVPEEAEGKAPSLGRSEVPLRGRRILVADDEPQLLELFARVLGVDGAEVTVARDGEEAWERILEREFDLIVADVRMPALDGRGLYERVVSERPEMIRRFVFSTGDLVRQETIRFLEAQRNPILAKPLDAEGIRRVLGEALKPR